MTVAGRVAFHATLQSGGAQTRGAMLARFQALPTADRDRFRQVMRENGAGIPQARRALRQAQARVIAASRRLLWVAVRLALALAAPVKPAIAQTLQDTAAAHDMAMAADGHDPGMESMGSMDAHMHFTDLQPPRAGDRARADAILTDLRRILGPYQDVRRAEADGFEPNYPSLVRRHYHFSRRDNFLSAMFSFDPARPTSLLYDRDPDGSFHLTGVMYTAPRFASLAALDRRVPLSVSRWHQHLNICMAPTQDPAAYSGPSPRFGTHGSIATAADCQAAGGWFQAQLLGWMVHIYPFEQDPAKVWAIDRDMH